MPGLSRPPGEACENLMIVSVSPSAPLCPTKQIWWEIGMGGVGKVVVGNGDNCIRTAIKII